MLRIGNTGAVLSIALISGASLQLRQPQAADIQIARSAAWTFCAGVPPEELSGMFRAVLAQTLVLRCLQSWDGIGDADGNIIDIARDAQGNLTPISRDAVASLLSIPLVFDAVERDLLLPIFRQADEKNASSPSPNGTSPGASKVELAPVAAAPIAGSA